MEILGHTLNKKTQRHLVFGVFLLMVLSVCVSPALAQTDEELRAQLNQQLIELQKQMDDYNAQIQNNQSTQKTLQRELNTLNVQINKVQLEIKQIDVSMASTEIDISDKNKIIQLLTDKISSEKDVLAGYIKTIYESDQETLLEVVLKTNQFSEFFDQVNALEVVQAKIKNSLDIMRSLRNQSQDEKDNLENKKEELAQLKSLQEIEKRSINYTKSVQAKLLKDTQGQESKYQAFVETTKRDIQAIKNQIGYLLQNGVSVEDAVKYGQFAALGAGIRPAFLLAELEQESALGSNVGKCYIVDATSGATRSVTTGKLYSKGIHPTRDLLLFLQITKELGRDPFQTPVSCGSGWGGAMGPAQFIPSTWMGYRERIANLTGHSLPDPWSIEDSFVAAATKLAKDGAMSQTREGEIAASKRYYCGSAASKSVGCNNYANSVQRLAAQIEANL
ncbi:MAG: hypothetical protein COU81_02850 [Candidatus Portnoybacteria bacterium CG10_big_fil_rev_8_21_14_0_10_36_7]|uniref:Transglycosylase SLT domain-containing protein n=1 Tax=Candidatus Portnoybacteria bacterium CG10_big_fil_rev_8_21_14_0_10_36_7 TaxID=1974812 RepID=A0A2M8KDR3_9BACT|nr:MAG: hypothetical protein COU81_02850 [Candidatus Portnoybacteria bacterium CG10_big_fil_rev_8_21_14_0_10_36_7]